MSGLKQSSTLMKKMMSEDIFYNDFTGDANIPKSGRIFASPVNGGYPKMGRVGYTLVIALNRQEEKM